MKMTQKTAKSVEEQIEILQSRGVVINDTEKAKEVLLDIGYFRLGFFSYPFENDYPVLKNRSHIVKQGTTFEEILDLYYFDCDLRHILMRYLDRIEINLRTYISYVCSVKYANNPLWFVDSNVMNSKFVEKFNEAVYSNMEKNPIIKRHHKNHKNDTYAPAWKSLEFIMLGSLIILYSNIRDKRVKLGIARKYGCNNVNTFYDYLDVIRQIRNSCAHGSCIYNTTLSKRIPKGYAFRIYNEIGNESNIKGAISIILFLLGSICTSTQMELQKDLEKLLSKKRSIEVDNIIRSCTNY